MWNVGKQLRERAVAFSLLALPLEPDHTGPSPALAAPPGTGVPHCLRQTGAPGFGMFASQGTGTGQFIRNAISCREKKKTYL